MHARRRAVVVRDGVEAHVLGVGDSGLKLGHDMVDALREIGPSRREVRIRRWHGILVVPRSRHVVCRYRSAR